jgi:hypothetical protein
MKDWTYIEVAFEGGETIRIFKQDYIRMVKVAAIMEDMEKLKQIARVFMEEKK